MTRFRGSQQDCISRETSREEERTQTDREKGDPDFQADCCAVPIPDIPEAAWLALGSEWLILEQHVLHSSNHLSSHKQGRAPHQQQGRALCLSICTLKKFSFTILFTSGKGHIFSTNSSRPILISLALSLQTSLATSWCCAIYPCNHSAQWD